jgi:hypothetical protein
MAPLRALDAHTKKHAASDAMSKDDL